MRAVARLHPFTGLTFIGTALDSARKILETRRRDVPAIVILLSDGFSQDDATKAAERLRKVGERQRRAA